VAGHIPFGYTVALLGEGQQQLPAGSDIVPGTDVSFVAADETGVVYAGLDADGNKDGSTGFRPWAEIAEIHVY
jgi:hypothetical protein